jgi:uncharacterized membrane protein
LTKPAGAIRIEAERNLALLGYGLLGVSIFFAGITALVAAGIAYALYNAANEELSRHFRFQIRIFWIGVGCILLTLVAGLVAAFGAVGNLLHSAPPTDMVRQIELFGRQIDLSNLRISPLVVISTGVSAGAALLGALWMLIAPTIGFIRLATSKHMGQTARP